MNDSEFDSGLHLVNLLYDNKGVYIEVVLFLSSVIAN